MRNKYRLHIISSIIGAMVGYFVFHPYTMLMSYVIHLHEGGDIHWNWENLSDTFITNFQPSMFPMAAAFALLGSIIGLMTGIVINRKKMLFAIALENEKNQIALETLKRLMVTLSHYLLNANVIIGGEVRHYRKIVSDKDALSSLEVIKEQARKIDSVISALRKITEIKTADYTPNGHDLMIDITREIDEQLESQVNRSSRNNEET